MRCFSILLALLATEAVAQSSSSPPGREASLADDGAPSPSDSPVSSPLEQAGNVTMQGPTDVQTSADDDRWYSLYRGKKFGLQLDAGAPDGAGLMALFRPFWWLRASGGLAYNVMGAGIRGGVTLMPVQWRVTPTLSFDLGRYFGGDLTKFVTPSTDAERALLSDTAYTFWSAQVGVEFGSQDGFIFYLRGGISHLSAGLSSQNLTLLLNSTGSGRYRAGDGDFTSLLPSLSLGFLLYVL